MNKVKSKIKTIFAAVIFSICLFSAHAFADTYGGSRTLNSIGFVEVYPSTSVGFNTDLYYNALNEWNYISMNMKGFDSISDILTPNCDIFYDTNTSTSVLLGRTYYYKKFLGFEVSADASDNWAYTRMFVYDNQMALYNMTDAQITENIAHEMGHALKLAHPTTSHTSVMNQGIQSIVVTSYDESEIIRKWGQ